MMPLIPEPYYVCHIPRRTSDTEKDPDTGNALLVIGNMVVRTAQSITQFGRRGSSHEVISPDYAQRSTTMLHMAVNDPTVYEDHDQVLIFPEFNGTPTPQNYVEGSGTAYWVDGTPADERTGPWPGFLYQFGGEVKLERVT